MKLLLVGAGAALLAGLTGVVFFWPAQRVGPEPIVYGRDACAHCRMHISQPGFAGELRDHDGVLTRYDDIGCMLRAMIAMHQEIPEAWVEDHTSGEFIPLLIAQLVRGAAGDTPMGSGIVAFRDEGAAAAYAQSRGAVRMSLEDVVRNPALVAQGPQTGQQAKGKVER